MAQTHESMIRDLFTAYAAYTRLRAMLPTSSFLRTRTVEIRTTLRHHVRAERLARQARGAEVLRRMGYAVPDQEG